MTASERTETVASRAVAEVASRFEPAMTSEPDEHFVTVSTAGGRSTGIVVPKGTRETRGGSTCTGMQSYSAFRKLTDDFHKLVAALAEKDGEDFADDWPGVAAQVDIVLDQLYDADWGEKDALKRVISVVIGIVRNADWTPAHARYLLAVAQELRTCYLVDRALGTKVSVMAEGFGLDAFRGTVSKPQTRRRYRLVEIRE